MISSDVLELLWCAACADGALEVAAGMPSELVCEACGERYPVVDGIPDLVPRSASEKYRYYRTDTLRNLIAPLFDIGAPLMSMLLWQCPPLRYVDAHHRAVGRSAGGVYVECPVGTGLLLGHVRAEHLDGPFLCIDSSWSMLRRAQVRFAKEGMQDRVTLLRADPEHLPLRAGVVRSLQSVNGLHGFHDRTGVLGEFDRVLEPGGHVAGSTLVRGGGPLADVILHWYEQYGVTAPLRSREYVIQELDEVLNYVFRHETYGSALFFSGRKPEAP